jgi:hypothetical protein
VCVCVAELVTKLYVACGGMTAVACVAEVCVCVCCCTLCVLEFVTNLYVVCVCVCVCE